jgi:hypothetical protein
VNAIMTDTEATIVPTPVETMVRTTMTPAETTAPAAAPSDSSSLTYIIAGVIAVGVIGLGAVLYFRRPPRGGHRAGDSRL